MEEASRRIVKFGRAGGIASRYKNSTIREHDSGVKHARDRHATGQAKSTFRRGVKFGARKSNGCKPLVTTRDQYFPVCEQGSGVSSARCAHTSGRRKHAKGLRRQPGTRTHKNQKTSYGCSLKIRHSRLPPLQTGR